MAHATISAPIGARPGSSGTRTRKTAIVLAWTGIVALAVGFVIKYVLFYYRHYNMMQLPLNPTGRAGFGYFSISTAGL